MKASRDNIILSTFATIFRARDSSFDDQRCQVIMHGDKISPIISNNQSLINTYNSVFRAGSDKKKELNNLLDIIFVLIYKNMIPN